MSNTHLFLVPTPIGNLEDITLRAIRTLKEVNTILAEDTRNTSKLLKTYEIDTPMQAYHQHNEHNLTASIINRMKKGESFAVVSDGGTPGISDPGFLLVKECIQEQIPFETLPGATAFVPALINSGFPNHAFLFVGFLPPKKGRRGRIAELSEIRKTLILYESPHKIEKLLTQLLEYFSEETPIVISREISKMYEQTLRANLKEMKDQLQKNPLKGELVVVIDNN